MVYTNSEKVDMLLIYGKYRKNGKRAHEIYNERFSERIICPFRHVFKKLERKMRREPRVRNPPFVVSEEMEINVLAIVNNDQTASTRQIAEELGSNKETVRRILRKHNYHSFKYNSHQYVYEADNNRRVQYCEWLLNKCDQDNRFLENVLFSDESRFTNNGMFNRHNTRYRSQENQHLVRTNNFQERFGINIWAGICGHRIVGPILFQATLSGEIYLQFLQNEIWDEVTELPLVQFRNLYFQQDGTPLHNSRIVLNYLTETYGEQVIATHGPVRWPTRSSDLTCLDFYLWGYLKDKV